MEKHYTCPHCSGHVKVGENIILIGKNTANEKGIILLHPQVGNYSSLKHPKFNIKTNESIRLMCPLCHESLCSDFDPHLSHLILHEGDKHYDVYFSCIRGEHSTYLVDGETVTATGEHSDRYTYFKMKDKFKKYFKK